VVPGAPSVAASFAACAYPSAPVGAKVYDTLAVPVARGAGITVAPETATDQPKASPGAPSAAVSLAVCVHTSPVR
jgi:hypothetical protein